MLGIWTRLVCHVREEREEASLLEVLCGLSRIMSSSESLSPSVRVYIPKRKLFGTSSLMASPSRGAALKGIRLRMSLVPGFCPNLGPDRVVE